MTITLESDLEAVLQEMARQRGVTPETLAVETLKQRFLALPTQPPSQDEWERRLRQTGSDCGVSLSHAAVSSEGLYD